MTDETKIEKTEKAAPARYESAALAQPVKQAPPVGRASGGGGGRQAEDVKAAVKTLLGDRDEWYLVAHEVPNAGRFYDAFRGEGAEVRVARVAGKTVKVRTTDDKERQVPVYDVYARIKAGPIVPWKKGAKQQAQDQAREAAGGVSRPPITSPPAQATQRPTVVKSGKP